MAKKNFDNALNNIKGQPRDVIDAEEVPQVVETAMQAKEIKKIASPIVKGINKKIEKQGEKDHRSTFIVNPLLVAKIKTIAAIEQQTYTLTIDKALTAFVTSWQTCHPNIDLNTITLKAKER